MSGIAAPSFARAERRGSDLIWLWIGLSLLVHILLFTILSLFRTPPPPPPPAPMDVTIADDVGLKAGAPNTVIDPAESKAPEIDKPEDSAPPPAPSVEKVAPAPPKPQPEAAPPPKPAPIAKPQPKAVAAPAPKPAKVVAKPVAATPAKPAVAPGKGTGKTGTKLTRPTGLNFGNDYFKGATNKPSAATGTAPKAAVMSQQAMMDIGSKIKQQVQPCANRQTSPGPGAERIRVAIRLKINRDGTLAGRPTIGDVTGVDENNSRYVQRVKDITIAVFMGCQPLRGLPQELYDVPNGWNDFTFRYRITG